MGKRVWGLERGDSSVGMQPMGRVVSGRWHWDGGVRMATSCWDGSVGTVAWGQSMGMGVWGWECEDERVGMGAWGWEHRDGSMG